MQSDQTPPAPGNLFCKKDPAWWGPRLGWPRGREEHVVAEQEICFFIIKQTETGWGGAN